jgi:tetratricopeptide (TPR) repeat protein
MRLTTLRCVALTSVLGAAPLPSQQLGTITFPSSAPANAQAPFVRGVLFLHSFEYESAAQAFRESQRLAPTFALAYWGEAMTYTHPVWNEQDVGKAREALLRLAPTAEARRAKAGTRREQMFMDAIEALYGAGSKPRRDTLYAAAMERLATAFPDDDESQSFYALALLGLSQGVRDVPTYLRAGAIAEGVLKRNEDHPGGAHYTIHAYDDPMHAERGLHAARQYSKIAPAAPHAQHMTTHIFLALGMWDDVVSQNIVAAGHDHGNYQAGHYTAWLGYGYAQQGRFDDARKHLETVRANYHRTARRGEDPSLLSMRAQYLINTERWTDPVAGWTVDAPNAGAVARAIDAYASAYAAFKAGNRSLAREHLAEFLRRAKGELVADGYSANASVPDVLSLQLRGLLQFAEGDSSAAFAMLRDAARIEDRLPMEFGPPDIVKPSHELLGEVLLQSGRPVEAQREFTRSLELAPGRARSLLGLGRAASAAGDKGAARKALEELKRVWHSADPSLPELAELNRILEKAKD